MYDLLKSEIVFSKKIGKNDGYSIVFINDNLVVTGDWDNNNVLLDLITLEIKKFAIKDVGLCLFLTKHNGNFLVCHRPKADSVQSFSFLGQTFSQTYMEKTEVLLLNEQLCPVKTIFELDDPLSLQFKFVSGKLFSVCGCVLNIVDIKDNKNKSFCFDDFIMHFSVSKTGKYIFVSNGFKGYLLNEKLEKLWNFENSHQMATLTAVFLADDRILVNANGKLSVYKIN